MLLYGTWFHSNTVVAIHVTLLAAVECMVRSFMDMEGLFNDELAEFMLVLLDGILVATIVDMLLSDSRYYFLLNRVTMSLGLVIVVIAVVVGVIVGIE